LQKAKATGFKYRNGNYSTFVEYEYKGHTYEVEFSNCMNYLCPSPAVQHRNAQDAIDEMIEASANSKPSRYEDSAEYGFNLFWEYVNQ